MPDPTTPSSSIKALIVAESLGVATPGSAWSIHISGEPQEGPDQCITVYDVGGQEPDPKWRLDYPNVQVRVRGAKGDYTGGWTRARQIRDAILGAPTQVIESWRWESFLIAGDVNFLMYDQSRRPIFTINVRLIGEPLWDEPNRQVF